MKMRYHDKFGKAWVEDRNWKPDRGILGRMVLAPSGPMLSGMASMAGWGPPEQPVLKRAPHLDLSPRCSHLGVKRLNIWPDNGYGVGQWCTRCGAKRYTVRGYFTTERGWRKREATNEEREWHFD